MYIGMQTTGSRIRLAAFVFALIVLFTNIYAHTTALGLDQHVTRQYHNFFIPPVISQLDHGRSHDYASYTNVSSVYRGMTAKGASLEEARQAVRDFVVVPNKGLGGDFLIWNDKGGVDIVYMAFLIFGEKLESIFKLIFSLYCLSAVLFVYAYRDRSFALFALVCFVTSICIVSAFQYSTQPALSSAVTQQKAFGVIGVIPVMHLLFAFGRRLTRLEYVLMAAQTALLIFAYFSRISALWMVLCLIGFSVLLFMYRRWWISGRRAQDERGLRAYAPVLMVLVGMAALSGYRMAMFHPGYFSDTEGARSMWHNAVIGFTYEPELKANVFVKPEGSDKVYYADRGVYEIVKHFLITSGRQDEWDAMMQRSKENGRGVFSLGEWDRYAKEVFFKVLADRPMAMFRLYAYYKPRAWLTTTSLILRKSLDAIQAAFRDFQAGGLGEFADSQSKTLTPLFWLTVAFGPLLGLVAMLSQPGAVSVPSVAAIVMMGACVQLPWMAAYPWVTVVPGAYMVTLLTIMVLGGSLAYFILRCVGWSLYKYKEISCTR